MSERVTTEQLADTERPADYADLRDDLIDARAKIDRLRGVVVASGRMDTYDYEWRDEIMAAIRGTNLADGKRQVEVVIREVAHE